MYEGGSVTLTGGTYDLGGENWGNAGQTGAAMIVGTSTGTTTSTIANSSSTAVTLNPSNVALNNNLVVNATGDIQLLGAIFGAGGLTKTGAGTLTLTGQQLRRPNHGGGWQTDVGPQRPEPGA